MASLQTHDEWRRFFPDLPSLAANEVAKTYPWVPILSREPFTAQLDRIKRLLASRPKSELVFLNDLQGAPSACGCGNPLCRWTSDYGQKRTTTPLGDDAATLFVNAVKKTVPESAVIPVWTTECEQHDGAKDGLMRRSRLLRGDLLEGIPQAIDTITADGGKCCGPGAVSRVSTGATHLRRNGGLGATCD